MPRVEDLGAINTVTNRAMRTLIRTRMNTEIMDQHGAAWPKPNYLLGVSWRPSRLGGECVVPHSPPSREGRQEFAKRNLALRQALDLRHRPAFDSSDARSRNPGSDVNRLVAILRIDQEVSA